MTPDTPTALFLGQGQSPVEVLLKYANRHGLVTGATGTGKTVTLQVLAEAFSRAGVPVFCADVKGDLAGIAAAGGGNARVEERAAQMGLAPLAYAGAPTVFWDLYGEKGHPVRTTVSEMGPLLLARLLGLNETQEGVLAIALRVADEQGLALLDLKDLRQLLVFVGQNAEQLTLEYGNVAEASVGAIQRALLQLESEGAKPFFGEPALDLADLLRTTPDGKGIVNVLAADRLMQNPKAYATVLLWLLAELFEELPEVGDPDKPKLVFFFDEAHLLFADAPKVLLDKIEQVVKLIRSKGVGIWFVTQNPLDVPDSVLAQLGNRVQHALRAFTPREQKAVRAAAETFRPNPAFSTEAVITQLGVGEALTSPLLDKGIPAVVERALIRPPASRIGVLAPAERAALIAASPLRGKYEPAVDRESAYEVLKRRAGQTVEAPAPSGQGRGAPPSPGGIIGVTRGDERPRSGAQGRTPAPAPAPQPRSSNRQSVEEAFAKSAVRSLGTTLGRELTRGILGSLFKRRR
jgi:DNA helicase HerA-like ATPase